MKRKKENMDVDVSLRREIEKEQEQEQEQQDKGEKKGRKKKKEKKRKEEPDMDVDVFLRKEIKKEQELQDQHSQEGNPHTENNKGEQKSSKKKEKKKRKEDSNMDFDVSLHREFEKEQELQEEDQHDQKENPHTENNKGEKKSSKKKEKKRKEEPNMDVDVSLHREIEKEQEQQEEDQHSLEENPQTENNEGEKRRSKKKKEKERKEDPNMDFDVSLRREIDEEDQRSQEENPHTENNKGEKKRSKKKKEKKRKEEGDQHSDEGNLLRENNMGEEKRSKKEEEEEEEKAETPSQKIPTQSSCGDHEQRKVKKARKLLHLAKENGMGKDRAEGVVYVDKKMAKKAKQTHEEGSNRFVKEDENASSKATKYSKKSRSSIQRGGYDPASNDDLLSNSIECSKLPLADQIEHVTNTSVAIDSSPKESEKENKKERKRKRVTFQDQINVADQEHVRDIPNAACENSTETVEEVWGVRFTPDEDEILKDAVWKYIKSKGWDEQEGLNKVFNSMKHKDARNCWADIKLSLPHRPRPAIRYRAHLLLEKGAHAGKWSEEEEQLLKRLQGEHGHKWREISSMLDRHRTSIKEKWRTLKRMKGKGVWTQGELQQLSDMVHKCLRAKKASIPEENKKPDHHILRDDINWEKIADTLGTHNHGSCCGQWYYNLQSSLVTDGLWANEDDFLLLQSLLESGACVEEEVEWDSLLDHRPGQVCSTRWKQMVKHLGENRTRQFLDKLDILARRYAPELLESPVNEISIEDSTIKENPSGSAIISDR